MTSLTLLPAVDVAAGRAAQVVSAGGGPEGAEDHPDAKDLDNPRAVAQRWVQEGASWLHLVDLDRAFAVSPQPDLLAALVAELPISVQLSGGLCDQDDLDWALSTGAARVSLSSAALLDTDWVRETARAHEGRIAIGLDVRGEQVVARGTTLRIGRLDEVLPRLADLPGVTFVVADASRDGRRTGADLDLFRAVAQQVQSAVVASGGVGSLDDIRALRALTGDGVTGAVLGSALYHGIFSLAQALDAAR